VSPEARKRARWVERKLTAGLVLLDATMAAICWFGVWLVTR